MNKISNIYLSLVNKFHNLCFSHEIINYINTIDNIGFEQIITNTIYTKLYSMYDEQNIIFDNIKQNVSIKTLTDFINTKFDNIPIPISKYGLYGFLCMNKKDEEFNFLVNNNKEHKILFIFIIKTCTDYILEYYKDLTKRVLILLNKNNNFTNSPNDEMYSIINLLKENIKENHNNIESDFENYKNDINLLNYNLNN
jgi:hypothetical protein